jgi:hypothetical protein
MPIDMALYKQATKRVGHVASMHHCAGWHYRMFCRATLRGLLTFVLVMYVQHNRHRRRSAGFASESAEASV